MKKRVKVRKQHICEQCGKTIFVGDDCWYQEGREPVYNEDASGPNLVWYQTGIKYWKSWHCIDEENCFRRYEESNDVIPF